MWVFAKIDILCKKRVQTNATTAGNRKYSTLYIKSNTLIILFFFFWGKLMYVFPGPANTY